MTGLPVVTVKARAPEAPLRGAGVNTVTCGVPGTAKVEYLLDNLGAAQGRLPDAVTRRRMEEFIERL